MLRFEKEVDPAKTKLLAWEGRFEPLLIGEKLMQKVQYKPGMTTIFPAIEPPGKLVLLHRNAVMVISVSAEAEFPPRDPEEDLPEPAQATKIPVEVILQDGSHIRGSPHRPVHMRPHFAYTSCGPTATGWLSRVPVRAGAGRSAVA